LGVTTPLSIVRIVQASAADVDAVLSVERAAFAREDEAALVAALLQDPTAQPSLSLLTFWENKPVGHVLFTHVVFAGASRQVPASILAPLAVVPDFQRQGVGRALIEHGASLLTASGMQLLFVLGHPAYYTRCGFTPAVPHGLRAPYPIVPEEAWMVRPLAPNVLGSVTGVIACAESLAKPEYWRE
jgi:putative acetyltransferase